MYKSWTEEYQKELKKGICEICLMNEYSVEYIISVTLSPIHVPEKEMDKCNRNNTVIWNLIDEECQKIPNNHIIVQFERLTGVGIKD